MSKPFSSFRETWLSDTITDILISAEIEDYELDDKLVRLARAVAEKLVDLQIQINCLKT